MAGIGPDDVDVLMGYDSFTITALLHLEDLGFCAKGEGGPFVMDGKTAPGRLAADEHQRRRALLHPPGHVRHVPHRRGGAPAARRGRRAAGAPAPRSPSPTARGWCCRACPPSCSARRRRSDDRRQATTRIARRPRQRQGRAARRGASSRRSPSSPSRSGTPPGSGASCSSGASTATSPSTFPRDICLSCGGLGPRVARGQRRRRRLRRRRSRTSR